MKYYTPGMFVVSPGLAVTLQLLHGDIEQLRREYMAIFSRGVSITRKLGFSDIIMPGENDFRMSVIDQCCTIQSSGYTVDIHRCRY